MENNTDCIEEWICDPAGNSNEAYTDFIYEYYKDGQHWFKASVRFDGCIHFRRSYNSPFPKDDDDQDCIHICDIDKMIKQLQSLREAATRYFGKEWNN